ncbi:right-handed parallel beta-helix repeat-containing protein [Pyxidicoccus parkwayensis]|uniref:Right-handed parallel beta-helix repeat-containing protein n=1 Tax=Pyxidicoccus parkwayensis TaxID=2813578 RepID=A0ABX7P8H8_9BACT|nr:right-handed parallel beta-helix repeat-containing protein [Pyxidicoccus parkwaysis]QSQ26785.1 right-handed parallel beta-helix repeat-containing protein [Pyxidicoccus parkwaysis]
MKRAKWLGVGLLTMLLGACSQVQKTSEEAGTKLPGTGQGTEEEAPGTGGSGAPSHAPSTQRPQHFSREWYVGPSGSDHAAGSKQAPFRTIRRALKAVGPGEVIQVLPGIYAESVVIDGDVKPGRKDAPITLKSQGRVRIFPGGGGTLVQIRKPHWIVEGFEIDVRKQPRFAVLFEGNTEGSMLLGSHIHDGTLGGGVTTFGGAHGVTIEGNNIHDFHKKPRGDSHGIVVQATSRDITIRDNDIHDNSGDSVQCLKPDRPGQTPARGLLIEKNRLYSNDENAVDIKTCSNVVIRDNDMHDFRKSATSAGEAVVVHYSARDVRVVNNRIAVAGRGISIGGVKDGHQPNPTAVEVEGNRITDIEKTGGSDGTGIRVENAKDVAVVGNTIDKTEGYGLMVGLGANNAPSENVTVAENVVRSPNLVRLGRHRPGLRMDRNRYAKGGLLKADPKEVRDLTQWKSLSGVDVTSSQVP